MVESVAFDRASSTALCPGASHCFVARSQPPPSANAPSYFDFADRPKTVPTPRPTTPTPASTRPTGFCQPGGSPWMPGGSVTVDTGGDVTTGGAGGGGVTTGELVGGSAGTSNLID